MLSIRTDLTNKRTEMRFSTKSIIYSIYSIIIFFVSFFLIFFFYFVNLCSFRWNMLSSETDRYPGYLKYFKTLFLTTVTVLPIRNHPYGFQLYIDHTSSTHLKKISDFVKRYSFTNTKNHFIPYLCTIFMVNNC